MVSFLEFINANFKLVSALAYFALVGLLAWFHLKFATRQEHEQLSDKFSGMEKQLSKVESDIKHLPTKEEVHRLDRTLSGLTETINATQEGINRLERKTDLLLENELRND
ncbi:DUF2730 domain-containing protein [Shewanella sp. AS1]|uniref:DUF2730 family protein n=1 Tax=Shewanella sp. AS1 TaxID=2907626 RepID=UPI001F3CE40E|nr:DUF2730 family protein [Shewanella sp. AS1]MCE9679602.1 DUF2730 domain-containing protein [Shewanella sp. AS1]